MKLFSGSAALPLCIILAGVLMGLDQFGVVHIPHIWRLWPVTLIAAGMEQLYIWTITEHRR